MQLNYDDSIGIKEMIEFISSAMLKREWVEFSMIDLSYYKQLSTNNSGFLKKVMGIFINETPKDILELEKYLSETNYKKVKEVSHKLKGIFKSFNLHELTMRTVELESHAKLENFSNESTEIFLKVQDLYEITRLEMLEELKKIV